MPRPIAYNIPGAAINGSITNEDRVISYVVDGRGNDYYNNYESCKWVPSADGAAPIVFVTDTFTRGYEADPGLSTPLFFACAGTSSASIIYIANRLPGSPGTYTNANTALDELNRIYGYFILESNDPFQGIYATNLKLCLDASKMTSYPQTANNWYDLSGEGGAGILTNGPTFNSGNGSIVFDGVDDYVSLSGNTSFYQMSYNMTLMGWCKQEVTSNAHQTVLCTSYDYRYGLKLMSRYHGQIAAWIGNSNGSSEYLLGGGDDIGGAGWKFLAATRDGATGQLKIYLNGVLRNEATTFTGNIITNSAAAVGKDYHNNFIGNISKTLAYDRVLSQAEILQNYYGDPIVTDGLVFAVDANNIVSYPKSGTTWYQLTGSANNGTLTNGPTFKANVGGVISLDGTDDFINFGSVNFQTSDSITLDMWVYPQSATQGAYADIFDANHSGLGFVLQQDYLTYNYYYFAYYAGSGFQVTSNIYIDPYVWSHIVITKEGNQTKMYKNGQLVTNNTMTNPSLQGTNTLYLGKFVVGGRQWKGEYGNFKGYNRALTSTEVLQNYQSQQYRFEGPAGPVTNGLLLYLDAGNLDSYPGTGTTIYDLSGQGANGTLINGVGFNQTNGGVLIFDGVDDGVDSVNVPQVYTDLMVGMYSEGDSGATLEMVFAKYDDDDFSFRTIDGLFRHTGIDGNDFNFNQTQYDYVNGNLVSTDVNLKNSWNIVRLVSQNTTPYRYSLSSDFLNRRYKGKIAFVLAYNRILTTAEVNQNYNFFKGRLGL